MAAGALVVGVTGNPNHGIAYGYAWNHQTEDEAREAATLRCREYQPAPEANKFCKLIGTFTDGCFALAFDPKSDSPGMGWAVGSDRASTERRAIEDCQAAAPALRREFCKIDRMKCDGDPTGPD